MPRIILKSPYLKPSQNAHLQNYIKYIATRQGVDVPKSEEDLQAATKNQDRVIRELMQHYPDTKELFEYEDYRTAPNQKNAGALILAIADCHPELFESRKEYVSYMANRPGAEKISDHGLFSSRDEQPDIESVQKEIEGYSGNIWTHIISLRREDAARLGYDSAEAWKELLTANQTAIAAAMQINAENFRWYAAFHNESHHPHIHMIAYSIDPKEAYLTRKGIQRMKSVLARTIFQNDLLQIYQKQTAARDELRWESKEAIEKAVERINQGVPVDPLLHQMLAELSRRLSKTKGKKVYGYLSAGNKKLVDAIVDRLSEDESIATLYDEWYKQRFEILRTYQDSLPEKIPLSQNKEFKPVRNTVIAVVMELEQGETEQAQEQSRTPTPDITSSSLALLRQVCRIFQDRLGYEQKPSPRLTDRKEWQKIREKMEAHGQKMG